MKFKNSFSINIIPIKNIGYINFNLCFKTGLAYEPHNKIGITHLLEHMLFRGVGTYDYEKLERCFKTMGCEVSGKVGYDYMSLSFSVLSSNFNAVLDYFNELFSPPQWTSNDLKKEKEIINHEINLKGDSFSKRIRVLYDNDILNKSVLGCKSVINKISLNELLEYFHMVIRPDNCTIFISGDIKKNDSNKLFCILSKFDVPKAGLLNARNKLIPKSLFNRENCMLLEYDYCEYSDLFINFDVEKEHQNSARFIQFYLSGYTSPLSEELIDEKYLSYELYSQLDEWKDFSIIIFNVSCRYNALCETIDTFKIILNQLIDDFDESRYNEVLNFFKLEEKKALLNPETVNQLEFYKCFYDISYNLPSYPEVCSAFKSIFSKRNFSVYATYSIKKQNVIDAISNFKNTLV